MQELKNFDLERIFTRKDFKEFMKAVNAREEYEFRYGRENTYLPHPVTGVYFNVNGRKCENGIWKDNYLYGFDCWRDNGGMGIPYDPVDELVSYEEFIGTIYKGLRLMPPPTRQLTFFDMEM